MAKYVPDPVDVEVGKQVRIRRQALGLTQANLGDALDVTFQQIQKYEKGTNRISCSALFKIAKKLKKPMAYFLRTLPNQQ